MSKRSASNGFAPIILLVGILVVGLGVAGAWYTKLIQIPNFPPPGCYYQKVQCIKAPCNPILICDTALSSPVTAPQALKPSPSTFADETASWKTYTNTKYGFEVKYHPESNPNESVGSNEAGQFAYLLMVAFGTNPAKSIYGYQLRISNQSLEEYRTELVGHITDKIDSEEETIINNNSWKKINYKIFLTTDYVPMTTAIINHAGYSFAVSSSAIDIDQILATFKFMDQKEMIKALDVYKNDQISTDDSKLLANFSWPKLKPFKSGDKTREVYLVDCQVANDKNGFNLDGIPTEVPNVPNIAEVTLKKLVENHYGGFPNKEEIARQEKTFNLHYKNADSGINGVALKDGNLIVNFYDSVRAYGGGSSRVGCMGLSTELTAKQFPAVKSVTMCIDKYGDKASCSLDFQP